MPPRRTLLRAGAWTGLTAALAAGVSGCGIRLEDDAPTIPFLTRTPIPDEALLVAAYRRAAGLAEKATQAAGVAGAAQVTQRHTGQAHVLRAILDAGAVPERIISGATSPTATSSGPKQPGPTAVSAAELGQAVAITARESLTAAGLFMAHRALGASVAAHDAASQIGLGGAPAWPARDPLPAGVAAGLLTVTRACAYAVQVAAAHLSGAERTALMVLIDVLGAREEALIVAVTPPPPPTLGYRLPFPVTGAGEARRLVTVALGNLVDRGLDRLEDIPPGTSPLVEVVRLQAEAVTLASAHGVPWPTMPGLRVG